MNEQSNVGAGATNRDADGVNKKRRIVGHDVQVRFRNVDQGLARKSFVGDGQMCGEHHSELCGISFGEICGRHVSKQQSRKLSPLSVGFATVPVQPRGREPFEQGCALLVHHGTDCCHGSPSAESLWESAQRQPNGLTPHVFGGFEGAHGVHRCSQVLTGVATRCCDEVLRRQRV